MTGSFNDDSCSDSPFSPEVECTYDADRIDDLLGLAANRIRRQLLDYLVAHEGRPVDREDATDYVAATVPGPRSSVELDLRHNHLPKLDDAGIVDYDGDRIAYRGDDLLEEVLATVRQYESP